MSDSYKLSSYIKVFDVVPSPRRTKTLILCISQLKRRPLEPQDLAGNLTFAES